MRLLFLRMIIIFNAHGQFAASGTILFFDFDVCSWLFFFLSWAGMYKGGVFKFSFNIKETYPHEAPKVTCLQKIYHPNINLQGNVCLNILREDWKPVLTIQAVVFGMQYLFLEPNPDDPLNKDAADVLKANKSLFEQNVTKSMKGGSVNGESFENVVSA